MNRVSSRPLNPPACAVYAITVGGEIDPLWTDWFAPMTISSRRDSTGTVTSTLVGTVADQAALRGIVNRLWNLNLTLLELHCVESTAPMGAPIMEELS